LWCFEKAEKGDRGGRIVFHKPHPSPKIEPVLSLAMGRRTRKWFGWEWEGFVLEDGGKEGLVGVLM